MGDLLLVVVDPVFEREFADILASSPLIDHGLDDCHDPIVAWPEVTLYLGEDQVAIGVDLEAAESGVLHKVSRALVVVLVLLVIKLGCDLLEGSWQLVLVDHHFREFCLDLPLD